MLSAALRLLFALYRWLISPFLHLFAGPGYGCRFEPSCSHYARDAVAVHGLVRGSGLAAYRVLRCNPFSAGGYDPVPQRCFSRRAVVSVAASNPHKG